MNRFSAVIFDCDGVLVDSELLSCRIEAEVKTEMGFPITLEEQIRKFAGHAWTNAIQREELARLPKNFLEVVDDRCRIAYREELDAIDGVRETLENLPHPKCVASSSEAWWLKYKLEIAGLLPHFPNAIFDGERVEHRKPAPDLFLLALREMRWNAADVLVVEDSEAGVQAARAAGLAVVGFLGGGHIRSGHADRLKAAGAEAIIENFRELPRLLTESRRF